MFNFVLQAVVSNLNVQISSQLRVSYMQRVHGALHLVRGGLAYQAATPEPRTTMRMCQ